MVTLKEIIPGSIAAELGLQVGDRLCTVDGRPVRDFLDLFLFEQAEELVLMVERADGEVWELEIEKDQTEPLGILLEHPDPKQCGNNCIFCFVHQLPKGMRRTLYIKDEDYRFSYLYGAYVTLSNIGDDEVARIIEQQLSPLYISVHATDEALRTRLLGRSAPPILPLLQKLTAAGIELHTQIVVCPGINDGAPLDQTIGDLLALSPGILSLALVPVGLTGHRQRLPELRTPNVDEARAILQAVETWQERAIEQAGSRFVFAADELYLKAQRDFPPLDAYEELPQIENGVGLLPLFRDQAHAALDEAAPLPVPLTVSTFTGASFFPELQDFVARLGAKTGCTVNCFAVDNHFFGGQVTVAGLLTGGDVVKRLQGEALGSALLVPEVVLRDGDDVFLDDLSLDGLSEALGVPCVRIPGTPWGILDALDDLSSDAAAGH